MSVAMVAPGRAMLRAPRLPVLWRSLRTSTGGGGGGGGGPGTAPNTIPGLSGWWDASGFASMADAGGLPLAGWGQPVTSLIDLSGGHRPATRFFFASNANQPKATPRLSGLLGGIGFDLGNGPYYPFLDNNLGFQVANVPMGAGVAWTRLFVWSRPNWKQSIFSPFTDASDHALIWSGATGVLKLDGTAGNGKLTLFPGSGSATVLSAAMTRRHTHAVMIRNTPGAGVDVWLDGAQAASGVTNPISGAGLATLLLGHDGSGFDGGAQCWFHELAAWERALTAQEIAGLGVYATRWALGPRKGVLLTFNGQSNAHNATNFLANADLLMAQGVAWCLGALAYGRASKSQSDAPLGTGTINPGMGIYYQPEVNPTYQGTFLQDPQDGSDPSGWSLGAMGNGCQAYLSSLSAADQADIAALVVWWSETDSYRSYASEWTRYQHAAKRWISLLRGMIPGATVNNMPVLWWNAIPFGNTDGIQMQREVIASLAADPTQNVTLAPQVTADSNSLGASWDPSTGIQTGGDNQHRDWTDLQRYAYRSAVSVARAILAARGGDSINSIPAGLPAVGEPKIIHAYRRSSTTVILTVQHDAGNDLIVPLQAVNGAGFLVMDGGSISMPGLLVPATACARVDTTHLQLTLALPLTHPSAQCLLFYPYGSYTPIDAPSYRADIGRGNAVTDNFASVAKPAGWDIASDLGSAWNINYPLSATAAPITLSDSPTQ